ncbi:MAG: dihydrodipicolinate synthase family protein [Verrucomicrobiales bacterium]|nr:dihydrodipicolinate synthase family protein [Verrucomicrobiales bacterium]
MNWRQHEWAGVFPATLCAFHEDETLDEQGLREYFAELAAVEGVKGLTCNGHTGEIMSLRPAERARVTKICAETVRATNRRTNGAVKVISGVSAEGSLEAIDHALAAKEAGADAILLMPPHHWLRFGRSARTAVGFVEDVAGGAHIDIVIHQYPAWTKAGYTLGEMLEMVKVPQVKMIKMGTRDMARWLYDYERLKAAAPHLSIVTCHDEFLLPSLVEGCDGALIGFAGFAPELMIRFVHCALDGDVKGAKAAQELVAPLARLIYNFGEPGCGAHQRMKVARWLMGQFSSPHFRRPVRPLPDNDIARLRDELQKLRFACRSLSPNGQVKKPSARTRRQPAGAREAIRLRR